MVQKNLSLDERFEKIDAQLERITKVVVKGFADTTQKTDFTELHRQVDIYPEPLTPVPNKPKLTCKKC